MGDFKPQIAPIYQYYNLYRNTVTDRKVAVITSDYNCFLFKRAGVPLFVINGREETGKVKNFIEDNLNSEFDVVVDSSAIRYPYYQQDEQFRQSNHGGSNTNFVMHNILGRYQSEVWAEHPANKGVYFLRLTSVQAADRINKIKAAYDRTDTNSSLWGSNSIDDYPGIHRLANFPNPS